MIIYVLLCNSSYLGVYNVPIQHFSWAWQLGKCASWVARTAYYPMGLNCIVIKLTIHVDFNQDKEMILLS